MTRTITNRASLIGRSSNLEEFVANRIPNIDARPFTDVTGARWEQDASIILLGIRGTGKTSLAVLAASNLGFRLVDADNHFYAVTGQSRAAYASKHGFEEYRKCEITLMRSLLQENPSRCIIVCGLGSAESRGQELLEDFKKRHPVIYIIRDSEEISQYLRALSTAEIARLSHLATPSYRALSNYEFYNLSESTKSFAGATDFKSQQQEHHPSLILKHVERDFLRMIRSIRSQDSYPSVLQARHSLSFLAAEKKPFTYALQIPFERVADIAAQLRSTDLIVDALELTINLDLLLNGSTSFDHSTATGLTRQYYTLRRNVRLPVIFHLELSQSWRLSPPDAGSNLWAIYFQVLSHGLRLAPEYLTLELRCIPDAARVLIAQKASTKIIGHFFDHAPADGAWDSPSRLQLLETAERWGCDLVRICQPAITPADNTTVQCFAYRAEKSGLSRLPLIAYNTGRLGKNSCCMNKILTPVTHELISDGSGFSSHEMLTVQAAQNALYSTFIFNPLFFCIFGNAVNSAMSPTMHNAAFKFCGLPHHYKTNQSSSLRDLEDIVHRSDFGGASISAPFKKEIITVLDYISPEAQAIGAVNTIIPLHSRNLESLIDRNRAGPVVALYGDNTDWIGIHTCVRRNLSPINAVKARTTALILGAGGMAQAAVYGAIRLGVRTIFIYNRTLANAEKVVEQFNGKSFSLRNIDLAMANPSRASGASTPIDRKTKPAALHAIPTKDHPWPTGFAPPTIVVSCIAGVGQDGHPPPHNAIPPGWLSSPTGGVAIELAYDPIDTPLLQQTRALSSRGWISLHGLQVLPEQGIAQFELFTGRKAPQHVMRAQVAKHVREPPDDTSMQ